MAHIIAFSQRGPRGHHKFSKEFARDLTNLMLLCPECHITIDKNEENYPVELLRKMKEDHERRIEIVADIPPENQSEILDVPPSKYQEAKERYEAVGNWLNDDPELASYNPSIYPQGSFALGTVTKPINEEEYDIDSVCLLQLGRQQISPPKLKEMIGDRLKSHKRMPRCWTPGKADDVAGRLNMLMNQDFILIFYRQFLTLISGFSH